MAFFKHVHKIIESSSNRTYADLIIILIDETILTLVNIIYCDTNRRTRQSLNLHS